jgi:hypothetical protein
MKKTRKTYKCFTLSLENAATLIVFILLFDSFLQNNMLKLFSFTESEVLIESLLRQMSVVS